MKYSKKIIGVLLAVMLAAASIMGCASSAEDTDVIMTVNGEEVSYGVVNFYATYFAAYYESYYSSYLGEDMWITEVDDYGTTYEDEIKDGILETMQEVVVVRQHAEELGVALTDEETAEIQAAAEAFYADNSDEIRNQVSGSVENIVEVLTLFEIDQKCNDVIVLDVDTEVSDEEAAQKKASYVYSFLTTTDEDGNSVDMTDDEIAALQVELEELIEGAKADGDLYTYAEALGYSVLETTFDDDTSSLNTDLLAGLVELEEGEFSDVIMSDSVYYVAQLTSEFDQDATDAMKETIISEREATLFTETVAAWVEEIDIVVNESLWKQINFTDVQYTMYYEDTSETTETTTEIITEVITEE